MNPTSALSAAPSRGWRAAWNRTTERLDGWIGHDLIALAARLALAGIFFQSGRTKVEGLLTVSDNAIALFEDEYQLPFVSADIAAHLAAYSEHLFPLLLVVGLATRVSAAALLAMTLVIQVFVYPAACPTHLSWAALALYLVARGGGAWTLDRRLGIR